MCHFFSDLSWRSGRSARYTLIIGNNIIESLRIKLHINLHKALIPELKIDEKRAVLYQDSRAKLVDKIRDIAYGLLEQYTDDARIFDFSGIDPIFY